MKICTVLQKINRRSIRLAYLTGSILLHPVLSGAASVHGDFNGDGFADLAIGMPSKDETSEIKNSGSVLIVYGSASGLSAPSTAGAVPLAKQWTQESPGVPGSSESGDFFGYSLAVGDFNGDTFSDLAIGAPTEVSCRDGIVAFDGAVTVLFGSETGLTALNSVGASIGQFLTVLDISTRSRSTLADLNILLSCTSDNDSPKDRFRFGEALSSGNFNGDDFDDLAIGIPKARLQGNFIDGMRAAGAVGIFFGSGQALKQNGVLITPMIPGPPSIPIANIAEGKEAIFEDGEDFGSVLASGDFNGDGFKDLAISAPLKDYKSEVKDTGAVFTFRGDCRETLFSSGIFTKGRDSEYSGGVGGVPKAGDQFGRALAAGDFNGDSRSDLAIGTPFEDVGSTANAGAVDVIFGDSTGLTEGGWFLTQSRIFADDSSEPGDNFGRSLAFGDFNADGVDDLAIGAPHEGVKKRFGNFTTVEVGAGEVDVVYGKRPDNSGGRVPQRFTQSITNGSDGGPELNDNFGSTLSAGNFGRNELRRVKRQLRIGEVTLRLPVIASDLAIGTPGEDIGSITDAGCVNVIYGTLSANGLSLIDNQFWTQDSPDVPGSSANLDFFGDTLY